MTWQTIAASETDANSPLNQNLMDKIRGNLEALRDGSAAAWAGIISQAMLKTSTQEVYVTAQQDQNFNLYSAGDYGFYPRIKVTGGSTGHEARIAYEPSNQNYWYNLWLKAGTGNSVYAQVRYIQASRDEPVVWLLRRIGTGEVLAAVFDPEARGETHPFLDWRGREGEADIVCLELKRDDRLRLHLFENYRKAGESWLGQIAFGLFVGALALKEKAAPRLEKGAAPCLHAKGIACLDFAFDPAKAGGKGPGADDGEAKRGASPGPVDL